MFKLSIFRHCEISFSNLNEIVKIKTKAWNYSFQEQKLWIENNLCSNDIHILLLRDNEYVAYLNLIDIEIFIDNIHFKGYGVGNVCSIEKGKGYGKELMKLLNNKIIEENRVGLLFCKDNLVDFYLKNNWKLIDKNNLSLSFDNTFINSMYFNFENKFEFLAYNNKPF